MRRPTAPLRVLLLCALLLCTPPLLAACAGAGGGSSTAGNAPADDSDPGAPFATRAQQVAAAWRRAPGGDAWRAGFVPLQGLTVVPAGANLDGAARQALANGWFRLAMGMPREVGGRRGAVRFADGGSLPVPLVGLAEAYDELHQGDPPPCRAGATPGVRASGPDAPVSDGSVQACAALTVTAARVGTVPLLTSRGRAEVPAWLFTVAGLAAPIARVAVAPGAVGAAPRVTLPGELPQIPGLVGALGLTAVDGTRVAYQLGIGSCDKDPAPVWFEADDVVVLAGVVARRRAGACPDNLLIEPVDVTLDDTPGRRPVLDGLTGQVLMLSSS